MNVEMIVLETLHAPLCHHICLLVVPTAHVTLCSVWAVWVGDLGGRRRGANSANEIF